MNGEVNAIGKFLRGLAVIVVVCAGLAALFYLMLALDPDEETAPAVLSELPAIFLFPVQIPDA